MAEHNGSDKVIRLTAERLQRLERRMAAVEEAQAGTNHRLDQTNARLDKSNARLEEAIGVLTRLVQVVKAQNDRANKNAATLNARFDRLTRAILEGRTRDAQRMNRMDRRLEVAERRLSALESSL